MKFNKQKVDLESLDELISRCEDSMINPFKKKKAAIAVEIAPEEGSPEEESKESPDEEASEGDAEGDKPDMSEMDMDDLLRMYEEMKSKKE